jgi:multiple antibiotic resistance protein
MNEMMFDIVTHSLYLLMLLNPVSKISVLSALARGQKGRSITPIAFESTVVAAGILIVIMLSGDFVLRHVLRIDLHSMQVAGGMILIWTGFNALRRGIFFQSDVSKKFGDVAIVPLACPMIAGPATITASLTVSSQDGVGLGIASIVIALGINLLIMTQTRRISLWLQRFNILGALIRLTGLVVMTMGVQMILTGLSSWIHSSFGA